MTSRDLLPLTQLGQASLFGIEVYDNSGTITLRLTAYPGKFDRSINYQWDVMVEHGCDVMIGLRDLLEESIEIIPKAHARKLEKDRG